jgi:hypothetical protein
MREFMILNTLKDIVNANTPQRDNAHPEIALDMNTPRPLGRLIHPDSRDMDYPMHVALQKLGGTIPTATPSRYWTVGQILDQGQSQHCVGFAWRSFLESSPIRTRGGEDGNEIYYKATELDEWPETHGEDGTSVRAGVKALQQFGHIQQYVWGYDAQTIAQFILTQGTVIVGTNWYSAMDTPQASDGFLLHPVGEIVGGHAWHLVGVDASTRIFKMKQSWGDWWGNKGFAYITYDDLNRLLKDGGEGVAALESLVIV